MTSREAERPGRPGERGWRGSLVVTTTPQSPTTNPKRRALVGGTSSPGSEQTAPTRNQPFTSEGLHLHDVANTLPQPGSDPYLGKRQNVNPILQNLAEATSDLQNGPAPTQATPKWIGSLSMPCLPETGTLPSPPSRRELPPSLHTPPREITLEPQRTATPTFLDPHPTHDAKSGR